MHFPLLRRTSKAELVVLLVMSFKRKGRPNLGGGFEGEDFDTDLRWYAWKIARFLII